MAQIERRYTNAELRATDGDKPKIVGHAALFNTWSGPMCGFKERIAPGAFKKSIKEDDVRALFNHDPNQILGRNTSGTLELREDKMGLDIEIDPPDTQLGRDLIVSIERGDVSQQSFAFSVVDEEWVYPKDKTKPAERTLKEVRLYDVSPVTYPAYEDTDVTVALRSMKEHQPPNDDSAGEAAESRSKSRPKLTHLRERELKHRIFGNG